MARGRALRVLVAGTATVVIGTLGHLVALVGRGRYLEDLCVTRAPAGAWAPPEFTVVRGPAADGLISFRCEAAAAPQYGFSFTDPVPLLGACAVVAVAAAVALLVWLWAHGPPVRRVSVTPPGMIPHAPADLDRARRRRAQERRPGPRPRLTAPARPPAPERSGRRTTANDRAPAAARRG